MTILISQQTTYTHRTSMYFFVNFETDDTFIGLLNCVRKQLNEMT